MSRPVRPGRLPRRAVTAVALAMCISVAAGGCADDLDPPGASRPTSAPTTAPPATIGVIAPSPTTTTVPPTTATTEAPGIEIAIRFERRTTDAATEGFEAQAQAILTDPRGWQQAGFRFEFRDDAQFTVLLAEPAEVDAECLPYDVGGQYSCQIGPVVALNADRWRSATSTWPAPIEEYRAMLVNHEVGHLLGAHHPTSRCPVAGELAPVMAQQSKGLEGCAPNPWPLPWEISCAARHEEPIAPPYEPTASPICGPESV